MAARKKARSRRSPTCSRSTTTRKKKTSRGRRWSARVTRTSHAMDTKQGIFTSKDPDKIASSLLESARRSKTRKTTPYQSAMSLLNFYENRGGKNLSKSRRHILDEAKSSLRHIAGRDKGRSPGRGRRKRSASR
ncbi:MAG TPA: DUF3175 domain-containing protein [Gammaproteobacteria bacterium]|nr:DUF3175 domain-containing protein [Gammaproteobacteria bacterium]